jgi:hypothetical protein
VGLVDLAHGPLPDLFQDLVLADLLEHEPRESYIEASPV